MSEYVEAENNFQGILARQNEAEERNSHLAGLDQEIANCRENIQSLESELRKVKEAGQEYSGPITEAMAIIDTLTTERIQMQQEQKVYLAIIDQERGRVQSLEEQLQAMPEQVEQQGLALRNQITELEQQGEQLRARIVELEQTVRNKEGHIEQLLVVDRDYNKIVHCISWRVVSFPGRVFEMLFPRGTRRRNAFSTLDRYRRACNMTNIKFLWVAFRKGGFGQVRREMIAFGYRANGNFPPEQPQLLTAEEQLDFAALDILDFHKEENPIVSIVIPVYNQFHYTYLCLKSILENSGDTVSYEIIIADDVSDDDTVRIKDVAKNITVVRNEKNLRFLLNCKNAAQKTRGKYILFLNNDTQVQAEWLTALVDLIERDDTVGMVGSKLIYPDGTLQEAGGIIWNDASGWNYGNRQNVHEPEFNYVKEADYISGASIMIRKDLWNEIGGFDERFVPAYFEDSDLAFEVRRHGYKVLYQPKSVVVHFEGISNGTDLTTGQKKYQVDNREKFCEKWKAELTNEQFENGTDVFLARDRGRNRKHVLVIDHYVPMFDKDAGSKTTFMYLKMLVKKGYLITFLGDNFCEHQPYTDVLQQMGIFVLYGPRYAEHKEDWLIENLPYYDVVYANRPHITIKYIDLIKKYAKGKVIYYGHDLHFLRTRREYELSGDKKLLEESEKWKEQEISIMRKADMSYYPSEVECTEIHKIDPSIPVKAITAYVYENMHEAVYEAKQREGLLFVGGFGHGPNLDAVKWFLDKIYPEIYRRTGANFYIVGSNAPKEIISIKMDGVIVKGMVSEEELQQLYDSCRMDIVPLRYGAGVKGKVVEALYYGIPVVTTPVGAEGIEGIENIVSICDDETAFIDAVCELYENENALNAKSTASRNYISEHFSVEGAWKVIKDDFQ